MSDDPITMKELLEGMLQYMQETAAAARKGAGYPIDLENAIKDKLKEVGS